MSTVETANDFLFGTNRSALYPMVPVRITTRQQAFRAAAWMVSMAEVLPEEDPPSSFDEVLAAIQRT